MPAFYRQLDATGEIQIFGTNWGSIVAGRDLDRTGTSQGAGADTIVLDAGASTNDDEYNDLYAYIVSGPGAGELRLVLDYAGATRTATVLGNWSVPPTASVFRLFHARRYAVQNVGSRKISAITGQFKRVGSNDGVNYPRWAKDSGVLSCPYGLSAPTVSAPGAGGVWAAAGAVYYRITGSNASGETVGSLEVSATVLDTTQTVSLAWLALPGATAIKVYRSTTSGSYTTPALRATLAGNSVSYVDDGSALSVGALPAVNGTGGFATAPYGVPPVLTAAPISVGDLEIGQQVYFWVGVVVPAGTPEEGNERVWSRFFRGT